MSETCNHNVEHKEVLGHVLCVCCSHCQEENARLKAALKDIADGEDHTELCGARSVCICHVQHAKNALGQTKNLMEKEEKSR